MHTRVHTPRRTSHMTPPRRSLPTHTRRSCNQIGDAAAIGVAAGVAPLTALWALNLG